MQSSWNLSWTFQNNHKFAQLRLVREIQWISPTHRRLVSVVRGVWENIGETFSEKKSDKKNRDGKISIENFFDAIFSEIFFRDEKNFDRNIF